MKIFMELDCDALKGKLRLEGGQGFVSIHLGLGQAEQR